MQFDIIGPTNSINTINTIVRRTYITEICLAAEMH